MEENIIGSDRETSSIHNNIGNNNKILLFIYITYILK